MTRPRSTTAAVLRSLRGGPLSRVELRLRLARSKRRRGGEAVGEALTMLCESGRVWRVGRGVYALARRP